MVWWVEEEVMEVQTGVGTGLVVVRARPANRCFWKMLAKKGGLQWMSESCGGYAHGLLWHSQEERC